MDKESKKEDGPEEEKEIEWDIEEIKNEMSELKLMMTKVLERI